MGNFNKFDKGRGGRGFGDSRFGGGRGFGGRSDGPRQMYPTTCSQCGQNCEVPFKPTGVRPVFCNNCFKGQGRDNSGFAPKSFGGDQASIKMGGEVSKAQFDLLNAKLDKILAMLTAGKAEEAPKANVLEVKNKKEAVKKVKTPAKKSKGGNKKMI